MRCGFAFPRRPDRSRSRPSVVTIRAGGAPGPARRGRGQRLRPHGIMPRHVGNHPGRRPCHVADHRVLGGRRRHRARAPVDAAAQAGDPARTHRPDLEAGRIAEPQRAPHRRAGPQLAARSRARGRSREPGPGPRDHEGGDRGHGPARRARARALPRHARDHRRGLAAAGAARHGDRHDPGLRGHLGGRRGRPAGARRRHRHGAHHDGRRPDRGHPGAVRLPLPARRRRRAGGRHGEGSDEAGARLRPDAEARGARARRREAAS